MEYLMMMAVGQPYFFWSLYGGSWYNMYIKQVEYMTWGFIVK